MAVRFSTARMALMSACWYGPALRPNHESLVMLTSTPRPSRHVLTHQIGKDGLKAYKHGKGMLGMGKNRVLGAARKFGWAEVAGQAGPVDVAQQGNGVSVGRPLAKGH